MKTIFPVLRYVFGALFWLAVFTSFSPTCGAQSTLSLQDAIGKALASRATLHAAAEQVSVAQGLEKQSRLIANPTFQFENQNLRPRMDYGVDVDTYAFLTQPLDILGKRKQRIAVASQAVASSQAQYELMRRQVVERVRQSYWAARGAQEIRDVWKATAENFQSIVDYHAAQFSVGAIPEQDVLRVRLESERLKIDAHLAVIEATRARVELQKQMGEPNFPELVLSEPLDSNKTPLSALDIQLVLAQRVEVRVAHEALAEAQAKAKLEDVSARPDLSVLYGFKRTELASNPDRGTNTAMAGVQITLPTADRNQGNRAAASAEVRRQQQLLAQTQADVRADYYGALAEYQLRQSEVVNTLEPLREHAATISGIAQGAYAQGGTDLLRLLDAKRAQLEAQLAYVRGMVEYQQSIVTLEAAEGVTP